jgi:hypothetical protein
VSPLEPDELTRLLAQAVEPVRPGPEAYQRIRDGIDRRRRLRLPMYALAGVAAVAVFVLAAFALQPGPSPDLVEPAGPVPPGGLQTGPAGSQEGDRLGSGGGHDGGSSGTPGSPSAPQPTPPATASATGVPTAGPSVRPTVPEAGSPTMPLPARKPARDGDVDGDGSPDEIAMAGPGLLGVTLSRGTRATLPMPVPAGPLRWAVTDVDGDGYGEIFVRTGEDGGVERFAMVRMMDPERISLVSSGSAAPLVAGIDAGQGSAAGFRCADGSLISYAGTAAGGGQYTVVTQIWRLDGTRLVPDAGATSGTSDDTSLFQPDCGSLPRLPRRSPD